MTLISWIQRAASGAQLALASKLVSDPSFDWTAPSCSNTGNARNTTREKYCLALTDSTSLDLATFVTAWKTLEERTGLVPGGAIHLAPEFETGDPAFAAAIDQRSLISTSAFYLDRYAVTNEQFSDFVNDGGYNQQELWPSEILPRVLHFLDETGHPSPRFWSAGKPPADKRRHPVVGVSWFEASAYARWSGKRLPTTVEWQRAATWSSDGAVGESRYPWGDAFDPKRANTWHSGRGGTVAVDEYASGATSNGIRQLIGNTWEWTADGFDGCLEDGSRIFFERPMAEIRGAAYDTYLETQATCQFRTGQPLLYRGPNVGFRCCIGAQDLPCPPDPMALLEIQEP